MITTAVMSLWTAPAKWQQPGEAERWSLSSLLLRRRFARLRCITDNQGAEWVQALGLPFDSVEPTLEPLPTSQLPPWGPGSEPARTIWALGKCAAYTQIGEPFLHFDADVFLHQSLDQRLLEAEYVAERPDLWVPEAREALLEWSLPSNWRRAMEDRQSLEWNFGTFGGNHWEGIRNHYGRVLEIVWGNLHRISALNGSMLSRWLEQWSFARHASFDSVTTIFGSQADAQERARGRYDHWLGREKYLPDRVRRVRERLEKEWPGQVARCAQLGGALSAR